MAKQPAPTDPTALITWIESSKQFLARERMDARQTAGQIREERAGRTQVRLALTQAEMCEELLSALLKVSSHFLVVATPSSDAQK